jgi:hypothetical protein
MRKGNFEFPRFSGFKIIIAIAVIGQSLIAEKSGQFRDRQGKKKQRVQRLFASFAVG